jgi:hypothetical protein
MPAITELDSVRRFVRAYNVEPALNNLPPASDLPITPQTAVPSEHPYKLHVGTRSGQQVHIGLTTTPQNGYGPQCKVFIGGKTHSSEILEEVDLSQPFKRLRDETSLDKRVGCERAWKDMRRGAIKGLAYWYLLVEVDRVGGSLLAHTQVRKYLVDALKRVGVEAYGDGTSEITLRGTRVGEERVARDMQKEKERVTRDNEIEKERRDLKRRLVEFEKEEVEIGGWDRRIGRVRARQDRGLGEQEAGQQLEDEFSDCPSGFERVDGDFTVRTDDDEESQPSPQIITAMSTLTATPQVMNTTAALNNYRGSTQISTHQSQIQQPSLQSYVSASVAQLPPQDRQPLLPLATVVGVMAGVDEFKKLKEMMDIEAALGEAYRDQLAKAAEAKRQWENHKDALRKTIADEAAASGRQ